MDPESAQGHGPTISGLPGSSALELQAAVARLHFRFGSSADHLKCLKPVRQAAGLIFWLMLKKFVGSYFFFTWVRRA